MQSIIHRYRYYQVIVLAAIISLWPSAFAFAQEEGQLINPLAIEGGLMDFVTFLVRDVLVGIIAPIVLTLALLYTGFLFIAAQGKDQELERAKRNFLYVIVGGILLLGAYVILEVITNTVDQLTV